MFQSDSATLSDVFKKFSHRCLTFTALEGFNDIEKSYLFKISKQRVEFMCGGAHGIAFLLDPGYIGDGMPLPIRERAEDTIFNHSSTTKLHYLT
jgi:hypothetical protein